MNSSILKKEFTELHKSLKEYQESSNLFGGKATLSEFFTEHSADSETEKFVITPPLHNPNYSIGHIKSTRIGVQKGSTLMKALSDRILSRPIERMSVKRNIPEHVLNKEEFTKLKKQRQDAIVRIIKDTKGGTSIADIKKHPIASSMSFSEKTLQRELVSMVKDGVLKKTGSKRWSRYSVIFL